MHRWLQVAQVCNELLRIICKNPSPPSPTEVWAATQDLIQLETQARYLLQLCHLKHLGTILRHLCSLASRFLRQNVVRVLSRKHLHQLLLQIPHQLLFQLLHQLLLQLLCQLLRPVLQQLLLQILHQLLLRLL